MALTFSKPAQDGRASAIDGAEPIPFWIRKHGISDEDYRPGDESQHDILTAYPPTPAQFAYHVREQATNDLGRSIASVINFFDGMLDKDDRDLFARRLLDAEDEQVDLDAVNDIISALIEEWTANPTEPSSPSTSSPSSDGKSSTAKRRSKGSTSST
jgi:hypothetical protein